MTLRTLNEAWKIKIKRPGAFTKWCKENGFKKASFSCIEKAKKVADETKNSLLKKQAVLAKTFKLLARRRKRKNKML